MRYKKKKKNAYKARTKTNRNGRNTKKPWFVKIKDLRKKNIDIKKHTFIKKTNEIMSGLLFYTLLYTLPSSVVHYILNWLLHNHLFTTDEFFN